MAQQKRKLPNRKWYSLEQAAEKLTREFNEPVTINDLLHFYICKKLDLSVYIRRFPATIEIGSLIFSKFRENEKQFEEKDIDFSIITEYRNKIDVDNFLFRKGLDEFVFDFKIHKNIIKFKNQNDKDFIYVMGFMNLYNTMDKNPDEEKELLEKGFKINLLANYLVFFDENDEQNSVIINFTTNTADVVYISISDLYITEIDLSNFIKGKYNKYDLNKLNKIINNKSGRPTPHKEAIIELAQNIFNAYPENNRESIAKAVLSLVNDYNYLNVKNYQITIETIRAYLRENNIGKYRGKSIKINKLERFKK
ncbi:hypothetical protein [Gallibacterium anatis]|uniref:hypothetical protein n=1 Tax=Gallibacterium anatis TaxID=750 RepID=UPI003004C83B